tara:strand:+ start:224 stop:370 length:147 start_codon:yes stop_codon:yes gene_type:complete
VVQKDGKILATYDDAHRLVEMHIKGLKAKEKEHKKVYLITKMMRPRGM